jgi:hypothetical protein
MTLPYDRPVAWQAGGFVGRFCRPNQSQPTPEIEIRANGSIEGPTPVASAYCADVASTKFRTSTILAPVMPALAMNCDAGQRVTAAMNSERR